jgi:hypothetical protein
MNFFRGKEPEKVQLSNSQQNSGKIQQSYPNVAQQQYQQLLHHPPQGHFFPAFSAVWNPS